VITTDRGGNLSAWDPASGTQRYRAANLSVSCLDCAVFSPDGSRIAAGTKGGVTIFDSATGNVIARTRSIDTGAAEHVRFTADGQYLLSDAENGSARLDRASDGLNVMTFAGHAGFVAAVATGQDNQVFATGGSDGTARLWSAQPVAGSSYVPFQMLTWAAYSPDGRTLAVGEQTSGKSGISEGGLAFYDDEARSYQEVSPHHHDYIKLGAFSPDGRRLVTVSQGDGVFKSDGKQVSEPPMVMLWDAGKRSLVATLAHTDRVNSATFSSDSARLLTASSDGGARLWNAETGSLSATLAGHAGVVTNAVFSANGKRIVTGSTDHTSRLWDGNGHLIKALEGHSDTVRQIAFSPDGSLVATGSDDASVRIFHAEDGTAAGVLSGLGGAVLSLTFAGDMRLLAATADGMVRLWATDTLKAMIVSDKRSYNGGAGAVSDDGTLVSMSFGDSQVRVFSAALGSPVATLKTLPSEQFQNFIPRSHLLMVTSNYGTEFWSLPAGEKIGEVTLPFAPGQHYYIASSGDRFAVSTGLLRDMLLWPTTTALLNAARQFAIHDLARDDRYSRFLQRPNFERP
jgi:WD40 repeat protein